MKVIQIVLRYRKPIELQAYKEAMEPVEKQSWTKAMQSEMESLNDSQTWNLAEKPMKANVIPGKCVYKIKTPSLGKVEKFKARYVAKSFRQIEGLK